MSQEIKIDPEFKALIPPLSKEEFALLEYNILKDGCRDPLTVWGNTLLDGHNRHEICTKHGLSYQTFTIDLPDREAAMDWMDANQLGRRNLTREAHDLLLGRRYNRTKKSHGSEAGTNRRDDIARDQSDHLQRTAAKLAVEHGVSEATVKRAGQFAEAVEAQGLEADAMAGKLKGKKKEVVQAHRKATGKIKAEPEEEPETLIEDGTKEYAPQGIPEPGVALVYARTALDALNKIPKRDPSRSKAISMIQEWVKQNTK